MNKEEIKNKVIEIAVEELDFDEEDFEEMGLDPNTDIETLLQGEITEYLESIQILSLVVAIEDHFQIALTPEDDQEITSFDDVIDTIARLLEEKANAPQTTTPIETQTDDDPKP